MINGAIFVVFILVIVDEILGTRCSIEIQTSTVLIGHHISMIKTISRFKEVESEDEEFNQFVEMRIQAYSKRRDTIVSLLGQASVLIPTMVDNQVLEVSTCRPVSCNGVSETMYRLKDYYLGLTLEEVKQSFLRCKTNNTDLVTEPSGTIHLRVQSISNKLFSPASVGRNEEIEEPILKESVDEVLSRIRRNKRFRALDASEVNAHQQSGHEGVTLSATTKDLLDRVKAVRAKRLTIG
jgi:hypothetical protein